MATGCVSHSYIQFSRSPLLSVGRTEPCVQPCMMPAWGMKVQGVLFLACALGHVV